MDILGPLHLTSLLLLVYGGLLKVYACKLFIFLTLTWGYIYCFRDRQTDINQCLPYTPRLGIEPATFWCTGWYSNHWGSWSGLCLWTFDYNIQLPSLKTLLQKQNPKKQSIELNTVFSDTDDFHSSTHLEYQSRARWTFQGDSRGKGEGKELPTPSTPKPSADYRPYLTSSFSFLLSL